MININAEKKTILFSKSYDGGEPAPLRECPLLLSYQCPDCRRILLAYFRTEEPFDIRAYIESEPEDYRIFGVSGAQGFERIDHEWELGASRVGIDCAWTVCGGLSAAENVNQILSVVYARLPGYTYGDKPPAPTVSKVCDDVMEYLKQVEGVKVVPEICGRGEPMFLIDEMSLIGALETEAGEEPAWSRADEHEAWRDRRKAALQGFVEKVSGQKMEGR